MVFISYLRALLYFLCVTFFSIPLVCQIHCEVPPRLYVLETALFVSFSTELQGVCWIWDYIFSLILCFESLATTLKGGC